MAATCGAQGQFVTRKVRESAGSAGNRGKGRKRGVPNKTTIAGREAIAAAFTGIGGVTALIAWANETPTEFFKLWGRAIPAELAHSGTVRVRLEYVDGDE